MPYKETRKYFEISKLPLKTDLVLGLLPKENHESLSARLHLSLSIKQGFPLIPPNNYIPIPLTFLGLGKNLEADTRRFAFFLLRGLFSKIFFTDK